MTGYIIKRSVGMAFNVIVLSIIVFFWLAVVPGDYAAATLGQDATDAQVAQFKAEHGLDKPVVERYFDWAGGVLTGDFGTSLRSNSNVVDEFQSSLPITLQIVVLSFTFTTLFGIIGGIVSAARQNSAPDYIMRIAAIMALAMPNFLLLTLLLVLPARYLNYAPPFSAVRFFDTPLANLELLLPATLLLALSSSAGLMRLTRSAFLEVFRQDYMRTARSKGLTERSVIFRHGFRNAIPPVLTLTSVQLANLLGGSIILEVVMGLPGLGAWFLGAISLNDFPIIMIGAIYTALVLMTINLIIDLSYAWLDPRIRYS